MGIYEYTLRAETKTVEGIEIGRYGYAYKHGWDWHADSRVPSIRRMIRSQYAAAESAHHKLRQKGVKHFVQGEWRYCDGKTELPIIQHRDMPDSFTETLSGDIVGYLFRKSNGRFGVRMI